MSEDMTIRERTSRQRAEERAQARAQERAQERAMARAAAEIVEASEMGTDNLFLSNAEGDSAVDEGFAYSVSVEPMTHDQVMRQMYPDSYQTEYQHEQMRLQNLTISDAAEALVRSMQSVRRAEAALRKAIWLRGHATTDLKYAVEHNFGIVERLDQISMVIGEYQPRTRTQDR